MIDRRHDLSIVKQAEVLNIGRGSVYYLPRPVSETDLAIMRRLDRLHLEYPFAGSRMLRGLLVAEGCKIGRRHVRVLRRSGTRAFPGAPICQFVLLADPHFILKPGLYRGSGSKLRADFRYFEPKVFLNASTTAGSCL